MTFKASGKSASIILGYTYLKGEGELSCYDILTGVTQKIPISVKLRGPALGLGVGVTKSLRVAKDTVVVNLSVQGIKGIGAQIGPNPLKLQLMQIRPLTTHV